MNSFLPTTHPTNLAVNQNYEPPIVFISISAAHLLLFYASAEYVVIRVINAECISHR